MLIPNITTMIYGQLSVNKCETIIHVYGLVVDTAKLVAYRAARNYLSFNCGANNTIIIAYV